MPTTCGYCSVGCGIEIGVKDGKAVASRPFASHPVNRGKLCPKGLSEHYTLDAENRAKYPLLRKGGKLQRVGWDEALSVMVERFRATQAKYGPDSLGVLSTGQLVTEEFYALGKLVQLGFGTNNYDGNTTLCMSYGRLGIQDFVRQRRSSGRVRRSGVRGRRAADRREYRRQSSHPVPIPGSESAQDPYRRRSARFQDRDDGGHSSAAQASVGPGAWPTASRTF